MSDYIYMLESRLSPEQNRAVAAIQEAAGQTGVNLFLTGGAMRDTLAGLRARGLDFVIEGNALKVAKAASTAGGAALHATDEVRKTAELRFPGGVVAQIAMSRQEKRPRPGAKATIAPATIQEDLRGRDFTCNAIALSLNKASRGLLLDPMNGLADIERREMRAVSAYGFYDDPVRLLRLIRFCVRLGFTVDERTQTQMANAREAEVEKGIAPAALGEELRHIGAEDRPAGIVEALAEAGLLALFSPALAGAKLNMPALTRLEKALAIVPDEPRWRAGRLAPFLTAIAGKLSPREQQALLAPMHLSKSEVDHWKKLDGRARKVETALRSARVKKPSHVYRIAAAAAADEVISLLANSGYRPVQDRLRNYFQKYLPAVQEITPEEWASIEGTPGTPKHEKAREAFITARLDRRPKKPEPVEPPAPAPAPEPVVRRAR
jgi:tRNA nucleotidyltransferase (CCA-adding enzyme)